MKEAQLAKLLVDHLELKGYECYKEVSLHGKGGDIRSDAFFVRRNSAGEIIETIAIETKTSFTLKVIHQAFMWKKHAHKVYVGIPVMKRKHNKIRKFGIDICKSFGVGVFEIRHDALIETVASDYNIKPSLPPLYEEQKESTAGNSESQYYTSFKHTVKLLHAHMKDRDSDSLDAVIEAIPHHYKTRNSAKSSLKGYITKGVIAGYTLRTEKGILLIEKKSKDI